MKASENEIVNNRETLLSDYQDVISKNESLQKLLKADPQKLAERLATYNFESSLRNNFITRALYDQTDAKSVYLRRAAIAWASGNKEEYEEHMRALYEKLMQESEDSYREFEGYAQNLPHGALRLFVHLLGILSTTPEDIAKVVSAHTKLAFFKLAAKHRSFDRELNIAVENPTAFELAYRIATMPKNVRLKEMIDSLDDESKKVILTVCDMFQSMIDHAPKHVQKQIEKFKNENTHLGSGLVDPSDSDQEESPPQQAV